MALTLKDLAGLIGPALYKDTNSQGTLVFPVQVVDARERFGRLDVLIEPVGFRAHGQRWVERSRVITGIEPLVEQAKAERDAGIIGTLKEVPA